LINAHAPSREPVPLMMCDVMLQSATAEKSNCILWLMPKRTAAMRVQLPWAFKGILLFKIPSGLKEQAC